MLREYFLKDYQKRYMFWENIFPKKIWVARKTVFFWCTGFQTGLKITAKAGPSTSFFVEGLNIPKRHFYTKLMKWLKPIGGPEKPLKF